MESLIEIAAYVLEQRGPLKAWVLAKEVLRIVGMPNPPQPLAKSVARVVRGTERSLKSVWHTLAARALSNESGFTVVECPSFRLRTNKRPDGLPYTGWENGAFNALLPTKKFVDFDELFHIVIRNANFSFNPPGRRQLFYALVSNKGLFAQAGGLKIGLATPTGRGHATAAPAKRRVISTTDSPPEPLQTVHEAHVESMLAENPGVIEAGLTVIGRQYSAPPVGRIDLLCKDKNGNYVVIELKKAGATTVSIIDQVTRYMGWVKTNLASRGGVVRGIIIVGSPDEKLTYSAMAVPHLETKCFSLSIENF
jgi:hypothetical protein